MAARKKRKMTMKKKAVRQQNLLSKVTRNRNAAIFTALFAAIGGFLLWRSYAASTIMFTYADLRIQKSVNAKVITEADTKSKSSTKVVSISNSTTATNSKAILGNKSIYLESGTYKACMVGRAPLKTINGTFEVVKFNGGVIGTSLGKTDYSTVASTEYSSISCLNFTLATSDIAVAGIITNTTAGASLSLVNVSFDKLPPPPNDVKPQIKGLVDRQGYNTSIATSNQNITIPSSYQGVVNNFVLLLNWSKIQPNSSSDLNTSQIDDAITEAKAKGMHIKLRVLAGINSPNWVKAIDGGPFNVYDKDQTTGQIFTGTSPKFWTSNVKDAYSNLMKMLAAKYDNNQTLSSVSNSLCTTIFGEPFIRNYDEGDNFTSYANAGLTKSLDEQCQNDSIDIHNTWWKQTRTETAVNPLAYIGTDRSGNTVQKFDVAFSISWVNRCRQVLGERCIMGNNGFNATTFSTNYRQVLGAIVCTGNPPPYFQTRQLAVIQSTGKTIEDVLQYADKVGAGMVELPSGYQNVTTPTNLSSLDTALEENTSIPCPSDMLLPNP